MRRTTRHLVRAGTLAGGLAAACAAPALAISAPAVPEEPTDLVPNVLGGEEPPTPVSVCDNSIQLPEGREEMPCVAPNPTEGLSELPELEQ